MMHVAKLIDTTLCIGCKACEVACQQWNDQEYTLGTFDGSYQTMPDLALNFWKLIKFNEYERDGKLSWLMAKYQCMHCVDPGCLKACPAPGAIVTLASTVDFAQENCIGCGYCVRAVVRGASSEPSDEEGLSVRCVLTGPRWDWSRLASRRAPPVA